MELENIELINAAENIAEEKGIEKDLIFKAIEDAISKASKTKYGNNYDIRAEINRSTGKINVARYLEVKKVVEVSDSEISTKVIFTDDRAETFDLIILCTGYDQKFNMDLPH